MRRLRAVLSTWRTVARLAAAARTAAAAATPDDVYVKDIGRRRDLRLRGARSRPVGSQPARVPGDGQRLRRRRVPRLRGIPPSRCEVTAAHEYNHVLQYGYDTSPDIWMFESTATWPRTRSSTPINDYASTCQLGGLPAQPLTRATALLGGRPEDVRLGDLEPLVERRYGADVRQRLELAGVLGLAAGSPRAPTTLRSPGRARRRRLRDEFAEFAAATAEWELADSGIHEGDDPARRPWTSGASGTYGWRAAAAALDHTAYASTRPVPGAPRLT